jgi:hypothetical protein
MKLLQQSEEEGGGDLIGLLLPDKFPSHMPIHLDLQSFLDRHCISGYIDCTQADTSKEDRGPVMGDKGKKDKEKGQKQNIEKQKQKTTKQMEKRPKRSN